MADKNNKFPEPGNPDGLSDEEARDQVFKASNVSLKDYDPSKLEDHQKVVELPNRASYRVEELVDYPNESISGDAKTVVAGEHPGGKNYPNGKAQKPASDNAVQSSGSTSQKPSAPPSDGK